MENKFEMLKSYCRKGWRIYPMWGIVNGKCQCGKKDCTHPGKHPIENGGYKKASSNPKVIQQWLDMYPNCNWALSAGENSKLIVFDIDPRNGGKLEALDFPPTLTVKTGGGGYHLYYQYPKFKVLNHSTFAKGIELKSDGTSVNLPPSNHISGNSYEWIDFSQPVATIPSEFLKSQGKNNSRAIVREKKERIETIPEGERNQTLFKLASSMRAKGFSESSILAALLKENEEKCEPPLDEREVEDIAYSVGKYEPSVITSVSLPMTDLGNAERFVNRFGVNIRWCYELEEWLIWNGKYWEVDKKNEIQNLAHSTAKSIYEEAAKSTDSLVSKNLGDWAKASQSANRIYCMIEMAKPKLPISTRDLDKHHHLVNLENGVFDLFASKLIPHNPDLYLTKIIPIEYKENSTCPKWNEFLDLVIPDKELQKFIQKAIGYSLTGSTDEQKLFFLYGLGANGKSTFIETIRRLFSDYSQRADIEALLESNNRGGANPYIARLFNARFVVSSEIPDGKKFNESLLKDLTGSDLLVARKLYKDPYEFYPTHKLWLVGNYKPNVQDTSNGFWRRMKVIPFTVTIPKEKQRNFTDVIREFESEFSGILNWVIEGARLWKVEKLSEPQAVKSATEEYKSEQDLFQQFFNEHVESGQTYKISKDVFLQRINTYLSSSLSEREAL